MSSAVRSRGIASDGPRDVEEGAHLVVEALRRADLDRVDERRQVRRSVTFEQRVGERTVRVHAVEAVVRRGDGGGEHLPLGAFEGGTREVVDQELISESAQVDAETWRQPDRGEDARDVGQPAHDRLFLRTHEALFVTCHGHPLLSFDAGIEPSMRYPPFWLGTIAG